MISLVAVHDTPLCRAGPEEHYLYTALQSAATKTTNHCYSPAPSSGPSQCFPVSGSKEVHCTKKYKYSQNNHHTQLLLISNILYP